MKSRVRTTAIIIGFIFHVPAYSEEISRTEFLKVTKYMMMGPCKIPSYIKCLGVKPELCEQAVKSSFKPCDSKVPGNIARKDVQNVINTYGSCMTKKITKHMKLTPAKLDKCESVLQASVKKPAPK